MTSAGEKRVFTAVVAVGSLLGFLAASRPWVRAEVAGLVAAGELSASGRQAAGVVPAVALVALAGLVAVLTTSRVGRAVAGTLMVLVGAAAAATSLGVLRTPAAAIESVITAATGRSGGSDVTATVTAWPWLGVVSGLLVALGGVLAVARARSWSGLSSRFDTPAGSSRADVPGAASSGQRVDRGDGVGGRADERLDDRADPGHAWDALTRGEDPTR